LNSDIVERLAIPLAPIELQMKFAARVGVEKVLIAAQRSSLSHLETLFASLQHRAFRAEL
jgi:type I restriction enzyme S subunit